MKQTLYDKIFFANLEAVYSMMMHSCRLDQFQLLDLLFILRVEGNSKRNTLKEGFLKYCFCMSFLELTEEVERDENIFHLLQVRTINSRFIEKLDLSMPFTFCL